MKKLFSLIFFSLFTIVAVAQLQHFDFNVVTPGTLKSLIAARGELYIFDMKVTGNIDARDIKCLRDNNPALAFLDLTETTISDYIISAGTPDEHLSPANELPTSAFANSRGTSSLVSIKLPNTITAIGESAFSGCTALTEVIFPPSLTTIGNNAFSGCTAFKSFNIPNTIKTIGVGVFSDCSGLITLTIPNSVTYFGGFNALSHLKDITIGNSVSRMGVITGCKKLETMTFLGVTPPEFSSNRFVGLINLYAVYVPECSLAAYRATKMAEMVFYILFKANPTDDVTSITSSVKVYGSRSEIIVEGTAPRETVTLYSITGKQLKTVVSSGERLTIPVDKQGIYLVKVGGKTYKVVV